MSMEMEQEPLGFSGRYHFFLQLATMLNAGCPLVESLNFISRPDSDSRLGEVSARLVVLLERGCTLSEAMKRQGESFSSEEVGLVRLGETTGQLHRVTERIFRSLADRQENRRQLIQAILYPLLALIFAVGLVGAMTFLLLPRLLPVFSAFEGELPWPTRVAVSLSGAVLWGVALMLPLVFLGLLWLRRKGNQEALIERVPVLNQAQHSRSLGELSASLSTLLAAGATLDTSLAVLAESGESRRQRGVLLRTRDSLRNGRTLSEAFSLEDGYFPSLFRQMFASGEESGRLEFFADQVATIYLEDYQSRVTQFGKLAEPFLLMALGGLVGFLLLACFLPFYQLIAVSL